jgi:hypothetical protein
VTTIVSMWGECGPRPEPNHALDELFGSMSATESIRLSCTPEATWALISEIERMGEFSPECVEAWWVNGFPARSVGGRFEGRNRIQRGDAIYEWIRPCDVTKWSPPATFSYTVGDRFDGSPSTCWTFSVQPDADAVTLRQEFAHVADGLSGIRGMAELDPPAARRVVADRLSQLHDAMRQTLTAMKLVLEQTSTRA